MSTTATCSYSSRSAAVHQVAVDGDRTDVVEVRVRHRGAVDLRLHHAATHRACAPELGGRRDGRPLVVDESGTPNRAAASSRTSPVERVDLGARCAGVDHLGVVELGQRLGPIRSAIERPDLRRVALARLDGGCAGHQGPMENWRSGPFLGREIRRCGSTWRGRRAHARSGSPRPRRGTTGRPPCAESPRAVASPSRRSRRDTAPRC